jgi:saccharopine dehydrogenase-like NADP-dependent oxidoreductase
VSARVVILGGSGLMGRIIAADLARTARGVEVVIADRAPPARLEGTAGFVRVDATQPRSLARALRGAQVAIGAVPYRLNLAAMRGALAARAHWLDLGGLFHGTRGQLRLGPAFREARRTAILGIGSSPGITNLLAVLAARSMDQVLEVHVKVGNVDLGPPRGPIELGYSADTLLDELVKPAAVLRGGRLRFAPPLDATERAFERFPDPIGARPLDVTLHSELATLPAFFVRRGVREVTFKQSFDAAFLERARFLVDLGLADEVPVDSIQVAPRRLLLALLARRAPPPVRHPARHEVLRVVVIGRSRGRAVRAIADCQAGPSSGWGVGPDSDTGAPPSIVAQMLIKGEIEAAGVFAPEDVVPVDPFVRELGRRALTISVMRRGSREAARSDAR